MGLNACYSKCKFEAPFDPIIGGIGGIAGEVSNTAAYFACYYANCDYGVGTGTDITDKVTKIEGWNNKEDSNLKDAMEKMNDQIGGKYQYVINPTTDNNAFLNEPLVLKKKQQ